MSNLLPLKEIFASLFTLSHFQLAHILHTDQWVCKMFAQNYLLCHFNTIKSTASIPIDINTSVLPFYNFLGTIIIQQFQLFFEMINECLRKCPLENSKIECEIYKIGSQRVNKITITEFTLHDEQSFKEGF